MLFNKINSFGIVACLFHLTIAISMLVAMVVQYYAVYFTGHDPYLYMVHRSSGYIAFVALILYHIWRSVNIQPITVCYTNDLIYYIKVVVHISLLTVPLLAFMSGWLIFDFKDQIVTFFGDALKALDLVPFNMKYSGEAVWVHKFLCFYLAICIVMHIGAAGMHFFVHKNNVVYSMFRLSFLKRTSPTSDQ